MQRLRAYRQAASAVQITVKYRNRPVAKGTGRCEFGGPEGIWVHRSRKHLHANDEATWLKVVRPMLAAIPDLTPTAEPSYVGIVFSDLLAVQDLNLTLFAEVEQKQRLSQIVDEINRKHEGAVHLAGLHDSGGQIPKWIPFGAPDRQTEMPYD